MIDSQSLNRQGTAKINKFMENFEPKEYKTNFIIDNEQKAEKAKEEIKKLNEESKKLIDASEKLIKDIKEKKKESNDLSS